MVASKNFNFNNVKHCSVLLLEAGGARGMREGPRWPGATALPVARLEASPAHTPHNLHITGAAHAHSHGDLLVSTCTSVITWLHLWAIIENSVPTSQLHNFSGKFTFERLIPHRTTTGNHLIVEWSQVDLNSNPLHILLVTATQISLFSMWMVRQRVWQG